MFTPGRLPLVRRVEGLQWLNCCYGRIGTSQEDYQRSASGTGRVLGLARARLPHPPPMSRSELTRSCPVRLTFLAGVLGDGEYLLAHTGNGENVLNSSHNIVGLYADPLRRSDCSLILIAICLLGIGIFRKF